MVQRGRNLPLDTIGDFLRFFPRKVELHLDPPFLPLTGLELYKWEWCSCVDSAVLGSKNLSDRGAAEGGERLCLLPPLPPASLIAVTVVGGICESVPTILASFSLSSVLLRFMYTVFVVLSEQGSGLIFSQDFPVVVCLV